MPTTFVTDENIKEFFQLLTFAVNQPNVDDLRSLINQELNGEFKLTEIDLMIDHIQAKMMTWFKNPQSTCYTDRQAKQLIGSIRSRISELQLSGCSLLSKDRFDFPNIKFEQKNLPLEMMAEFLGSNHSNLLVILANCVFLMGLQLNQMLTNYLGRSDNNYIFQDLSELVKDKMSQVVLSALARIKFFVISCDLDLENEDVLTKVSSFVKQMFDKVAKCKHLKIILLTERNIEELLPFIQNHQYKSFKVFQCGLSDLIRKSQINLLESSTLNFQGQTVKLDKVFDDKESQKMIDAKLLTRLLKGEKVSLANSFSFGDQIDRTVYVKRFLCTEILFPSVCLRERSFNHEIVVSDDSRDFENRDQFYKTFYDGGF